MMRHSTPHQNLVMLQDSLHVQRQLLRAAHFVRMRAMTKTSETCCHQKPPERNLGTELAQALHAPKRIHANLQARTLSTHRRRVRNLLCVPAASPSALR